MVKTVLKKILKGSNMSKHTAILEEVEKYIKESEAFDTKGNKAAATRARKALGELGKLCKDRRKEIQEIKNAM
tara:strand:- start:931 stop:1149 length:219 start_codon:yes stop_codon:yes gene_type:complete